MTGIMCGLLIAGCGANAASSADTGEPETKQEETKDNSQKSKKNKKSKRKKDTAPEVSKEQCAEEIESLLKTEPVRPDNAAVLKAMTDCATCAGAVDKDGAIFSELDNDRKAWLRYRFLEAVMWGDSDLYEEIAKVLDDDTRVVPVEDAKKLFLDAYGDGEFTPTEYERVEDGNIIPQFGDGEAVDLVMAAQYFEDDDYILLTGPMFYESNGEGEKYEGCADVLYSKNPSSRFGATLLYGRLRDANINITSVETSSELPSSGGKSYSGKNLIDNDPTTVWAEGVSGTGVGETVTLHLDKTQPVYGIQIVLGYTASYDLYNDNGLPTDLDVDFGGGVHAEGHDLEGLGNENFSAQDLADMNRYRIGLEEPVMTDTVTITITGAKKGAKYDDICVSEVLVYGTGNPAAVSGKQPGLTSEKAEEIANELGGLAYAIEFHDYDGDGSEEAYVAVGEPDDLGGYMPTAVWFIASDGTTKKMRDDFDGLSMYSDESGYFVEYAAEKKGFFSAECGGYGSGWLNILFGVRDGKPYELDLSMKIEGFYQDKPGVFYTLTDDFTDGHKYMVTELSYDSATGQFTKGKVTDRNWAE